MRRNLSKLRPGESARVAELKEEGARKRRLLDLGLTPGTLVTVERAAPFGDPVVIRLRGYALSLRREEARRIWLE